MSATDTAVDPLRAFKDALPPSLRHELRITAAVTVYVHRAIREHGWTVKQLVAECTRNTAGIYQPGGLITDRLRQAADRPPPGTTRTPKLPLCGECDNGWIYTEPPIEFAHLPIKSTRCPCRGPA